METKKILEEIYTYLKKCPIRYYYGMELMRCDFKDHCIEYNIDLRILGKRHKQFFNSLDGGVKSNPTVQKLAKFSVEKDKVYISGFYSNDIELAEILQEIKENYVKEHVL